MGETNRVSLWVHGSTRSKGYIRVVNPNPFIFTHVSLSCLSHSSEPSHLSLSHVFFILGLGDEDSGGTSSPPVRRAVADGIPARWPVGHHGCAAASDFFFKFFFVLFGPKPYPLSNFLLKIPRRVC